MDDKPKGTGFVIAADDGGLYEISQDDLLRAAKKVSADDPGYRVLQDAANAGLTHALTEASEAPEQRNPFFVCKTFSQCSFTKNYFVNLRDGERTDDDG